MLSSGMDNLTRLAAIEPGFAPAAAPPSGAGPSFGDYLRQAQTQPSQPQRGAAGPAPSPSSPTSAQDPPHSEGTREAVPTRTADNGREAASPPKAEDAATGQQNGQPSSAASGSAPSGTGNEQATGEDATDSSPQSTGGDARGKTAAGEPETGPPEHRDKNSDQGADIVDLQAVAAVVSPPAPPAADAVKSDSASLSVVPGTATAAGVGAPGGSDDGKAARRAGSPGNPVAAATSAGRLAGKLAQPGADQPGLAPGGASSNTGGPNEQAAALARAQPASTVSGQSVGGPAAGAVAAVAVEAPLPTAAATPGSGSSAAWATASVDATQAAQANQANQATQAAATPAPGAVAMAASGPGPINRATRAVAAATAGDALSPASATPGAATAAPGAGGQTPASPAATAAPQGPQTADTAAVDRARLVQRVEQAVQSMSGQAGSIRLRLSPPELGSLRIALSVRQGELNARLEVENSSARNLLLDHLGELRDRLAQQNIKIQQFDVDVADRRPGGTGGQAGQFGQYAQSNTGQGGSPWAPAASQPGEVPSPIDAAAPPAVSGENQLNVVV
ncbi:MAG: flagellar hook-length control protein FliK [Thermoguttaceae bacterium]|jgi:flagellar hook-length control protein FliK